MRRACLAQFAMVLILLAGCQHNAHQQAGQHALLDRIDASLSSAVKFMVQKQSPDGTWRSSVYGFFADGSSLTPHVVTCLFFIPNAGPDAQNAFKCGTQFLVSLVGEDGVVGDDLNLIYPVYTAAESSRIIPKAGQTAETLRAQAAYLAYLRSHQLNEALGWKPDDVEYGGWGYALTAPRKRPGSDFRGPWDFSNLSATLYGIATLRSAKVPTHDPSYKQALLFVQRCQNFTEDPAKTDPRFDDGGFIFSPATTIHNKGGVAGADSSGRTRYHSYGSMTADGYRALLACGLPPDHPRVRAAEQWLVRNFAADHNPGKFVPGNEDIRNSTFYYYCWSMTHAIMHFKDGKARRDIATAMADELLAHQRPDGTWSNRCTDAKEDDPLVATPFAASALAICRHIIAGSDPASVCAPTPRP